jgi:signal transduction histidine kinase
MTFRNKILLSIWGVVLSLLVITFFVINYWTRSRIEQTFRQELRAGYSVVNVHEKLQSLQLIRACTIIAESPRLRAVAELGDARTAYQLLEELNKTTLSQVFVLTDRAGRPLVQLLRGQRDAWDVSAAQTIHDAARYQSSSDVWLLRGRPYRIVSVPMIVEQDLVGTLTIGFEITGTDIATLKQATNSDVVLFHHIEPLLSTLDSLRMASVLLQSLPEAPAAVGPDAAARTISLETGAGTYLAMVYRLNGDGPQRVSYLILKPFSSEVQEAMGSILGTFGLVSIVFLALTTVIGLVISRSITRPISALVQGASEISKGNYDHALSVRGKGEMSILAARFLEMSSALKEKLSLLNTLNADLVKRNAELDETLRKLQSAQEELVRSERLAATGKMTAQLAHEINNPIHNIQSCLKTALGRLPDETKGRELIVVAHDEVNRLSRLTTQMLTFYRSSLVEDEMKPTNVSQVLREVVLLAEGEFVGGSISLSVEIEPDLPVIHGSRDKLKQVFLNLIANACEAMPDGGSLEVRACSSDGVVLVSVHDTGVGIAPEHRNKIFDAFFTTKNRVSGVGMGLSVSYGIVNQHRGSIDVTSTPGQGSTFTVSLPCGSAS